MERPVKGDVVVVPFPFSDLSATKRCRFRDDVDAKLLAALDGGEPVEMTKQWRDERRAELKKRIAKRGAKP